MEQSMKYGEGFRGNDDVKWPHVICGDFDSIEKGMDTRDSKLIHLPDQDHTDLTKTIEWCLEQSNQRKWKFERILVLGGLNGRFDHTMSTLSTLIHFVNSRIPIVVLDAYNMLFSLPEGESEVHVDSEKTSKMCGVIPMTQKETIVTSKGLKYDMTDLPLAFGKLISSSNEVTTNQISLKSTAPLIFTIELINETF